MESYRPESPRTLPQLRPGIFGKKRTVIPSGNTQEYFHKLIKFNGPLKPKRFRPVQYWRGYVKDLERTGTEKSILDRIQSDHEEWENEHPENREVSEKEVISVPNRVDSVVVNMTVTKTGKIKVHTIAPMATLYEKYHSKGIRPPLDEFLKALKKFGYSERILLNVLEKSQRREAKSAELDAFIERIFGKGGGKASKPKAKSVMDQLSSMFKIKR